MASEPYARIIPPMKENASNRLQCGTGVGAGVGGADVVVLFGAGVVGTGVVVVEEVVEAGVVVVLVVVVELGFTGVVVVGFSVVGVVVVSVVVSGVVVVVVVGGVVGVDVVVSFLSDGGVVVGLSVVESGTSGVPSTGFPEFSAGDACATNSVSNATSTAPLM